MFSRILIKLIDQAIVPAVLLIAVRVVSVLAIANYLQLKITLSGSGFNITDQANGASVTPETYVIINSYSTLSIVITMAVILFFIITKSLVLHDTHIKPGLGAKMFSLKLSHFIQNSFQIYSQALVWMAYLYMLGAVSGVMALNGTLYTWVFFVTLSLAIISTVVFVIDVEYKINMDKLEVPQYEEEETLVTIK